MRISSIVTTCVRPDGVSYLESTLASLRAAGFEPDVMLDHELKGSYRNFKDALRFVSQDDVDAVLVFQDDIEVASGLRDWLDDLWPVKLNQFGFGVVSLYTSGPHDQTVNGWHRMNLTPRHEGDTPWGRSYGALAYLFPIGFARRFVKDDHRPEMLNATDRNVAEWCSVNGIPLLLHSPSLVRHTGEVSTFTKRYPKDVPLMPCIAECRQAKRFCADVAELNPSSDAPAGFPVR